MQDAVSTRPRVILSLFVRRKENQKKGKTSLGKVVKVQAEELAMSKNVVAHFTTT